MKKYPIVIMVMLLTMLTNFAAFAQCGGYTLTQGAYGNTNGAGPRALSAFSGSVTIGCAGGNTLTLTSVSAIQAFLPSGTSASVLDQSYTNPGNSYSNVLAGQLVALSLNVMLGTEDNLGGQIILSGPYAGKTVSQFLQIANDVIGGCASGDVSAINALADAINNYYDEGKTNSGLLSCCDNVGPVFSGVDGDKTIECSDAVVFSSPTATDAQDGAAAISYTDSRSEGTCSYTITRTWSATDNCNNTTTASQTITIKDTTAPVLAGVPVDASASCDNVPAAAAVTATDNCNGASVALSESTTAGNCAGNYTITRTWTATDACGNSSSATQVITVTDTQAPAFADVSSNTTVSCGNVPAAVAPTATDNCSGVAGVAFNESVTAGNCAGNYTITRTWTATDGCGNSATATQTISVIDNQAPVFANVPANATASCSNIPTSVAPTATDNCSGVTMAFNESTSPVDCSGNYTITRTWTATDGCGNTSSASQTITVNEIACKYTTVTQGGWGANCSGGNWGCYLDRNFAANFPTGLTVGSVANGKYVSLTSASAIHAFLPTGGTPSALTKAWTNPTKKTLPNTLVGQAVTLTLNVKFFPNSANLVVLHGSFAGQTVNQMLAIANAVLGGSNAYSASSVNDVLNSININFDNGNGTNLGFLGYCVPNSGSRDISGNTTTSPAAEFVTVSTYPNPFVDRVKIEFTVEETSQVDLQLFNSNGVSVGTMFNGVAEKGVQYNTEFTSSQPGMYIYRMSTSRGIITGKVIQIK